MHASPTRAIKPWSHLLRPYCWWSQGNIISKLTVHPSADCVVGWTTLSASRPGPLGRRWQRGLWPLLTCREGPGSDHTVCRRVYMPAELTRRPPACSRPSVFHLVSWSVAKVWWGGRRCLPGGHQTAPVVSVVQEPQTARLALLNRRLGTPTNAKWWKSL